MQQQRGFGLIWFILLVGLIIGCIVLGIYLVKLDNIIRDRFEGQRWDIPAKVYARPLELTAQSGLSQDEILNELKLLNYQKTNNDKQTGAYTVKGNQMLIHTRGFDFGDSKEPERIIELNFKSGGLDTIRATNPSKNGVLRLEPMEIGGIYPQHNEDRVLVKIQNVPQTLIDALISTEDRNFYQHYGLSLRGTARAIVSNVQGGRRQGGSTITQQLVKNFYLSSERTYKRKINEAFMSMLLELHYNKNEILEAYLNEVNLGQNGNYSVNGYGLASQFYFGKPLRELNTAQMAFLVGIVNGPSYYNPWKSPERALERRNIVLNNMLVNGKLSQADYDKEVKRPLGVLKSPGVIPVRFPDYMDIVRRQLKEQYNEEDITNKGLKIFTALDPQAQNRIQTTFVSSVNRLSSQSSVLNGLQGAVIVSQPKTGEIVAAVGGTTEFTGFNRVIDARRQVGSLLKPVIYLQAMQSGRYSWASRVNDSAVVIKAPGFKDWSPKNYGDGEHGLTQLQTALANSYNLTAVRLAQEAGTPVFINNLRKLGIRSPIESYPSIWLGAVNLSLLEMLGVYHNFAAAGTYRAPSAIRAVVDADGRTITKYNAQQPVQTIDPNTAYVMDYGLQQVMKNGTGRAGYNAFPELNVAGKSGTTNDARDSWFAGYTGNYLAVVWLGDDTNKPIGLTGSSGALPVWINVMRQLKNTKNDLQQPAGVEWKWVESDGEGKTLLSSESCQGASYIPMLVNTVPRTLSPCTGGDFTPNNGATIYDDFGSGASMPPKTEEAPITRFGDDNPPPYPAQPQPQQNRAPRIYESNEPDPQPNEQPSTISQGGYRSY
ncbi:MULTISPECIES: penicillin-binding protein 1B [unclassified Acinetobacter]|uniref:penicillin-binding protein 1B n=1 Tax=unclassified Acinetobacter TaxID=196816 RepID=UPI0035B83517